MSLLLYVFMGFVISLIFLYIPNIELKSKRNFLILWMGWLPLFMFGLVLISIYDRHKIII
ncbi:MAG TPA: hypothetical protein GX497_12450 [Bacillus bacterium]|nr:hypothetical protein [Bacillus sp. (in: firmicutes)]